MKAFNLALMSLVMISSLSAHAIVRPGWERPLYTANLTEVDDAGHETRTSNNPQLMMNKLDGAQHATSLTFSETQVRYCVMAPCPQPHVTMILKIKGEPKHVGRTLVYQAVELSAHGPATRATLVEDPSHSTWNLELKNGRSDRHFEGEYSPVYTIQGTGGVQ